MRQRKRIADIPELMIPNDKYERPDRPRRPPPPPNDPPNDPPNPPNDPPGTPGAPKNLRLITQNWGPGGRWDDFAQMIRQHNPHVIAFQEAGDQAIGLRNIVRQTGYRLLDGNNLPGQASTPILWNPKLLDLDAPMNVLLKRGTRIKTNSGGWMRMKDKYWIGGRFRVEKSRLKFAAGSVHWVYNQDHEPNGQIAIDMSKNMAQRLAPYRDLIFGMGDYNARYSSPRMNPLENAGWQSAQKAIGEKNTGHGPIDDIKWRSGKPPEEKGNRFRVKDGFIIPNSSDHHGLLIRGEIV